MNRLTCELGGHIIGFDEYMNLVLGEAEEVHMKNQTRKYLGDNILYSAKR